MKAERSAGGSSTVDLQLGNRLRIAMPLIALAVALIALGGVPFAIGVAVIAAAAVLELLRMVSCSKPVQLVTAGCAVAMIGTAYFGGRDGLVIGLMGSLALVFATAAAGHTSDRSPRAASAAYGLLAVVWIGLALAHGVMLRELPHGGALVTMTLLATFLGDSAAHVFGSKLGRTLLAPSISPRKTVEGLLAGVVVGAGSVVLFALGWHGGWLEPYQALALGFAASVAAPAGDLSESMLKRSVGVKDSGRMLGPHGGVLDRIDAVLFTSVAGYYVALGLV